MISKELAHLVTHYVNEKGETVSPKKLQKLLYYVESWHLVYMGKPLIEEDFEAWVHGPVLPSIYKYLKGFGFNNILIVNDELNTVEEEMEGIKSKLNPDQIELINNVLDGYASLSAFQLELLSHSEKPWLDARGDLQPHQLCSNIISKEEMKKFYGQKVSN
jgi:uncharacterized phage-associated protein